MAAVIAGNAVHRADVDKGERLCRSSPRRGLKFITKVSAAERRSLCIIRLLAVAPVGLPMVMQTIWWTVIASSSSSHGAMAYIGDQDPLFGPSKRAVARLSNARLVVLPGLDHGDAFAVKDIVMLHAKEFLAAQA